MTTAQYLETPETLLPTGAGVRRPARGRLTDAGAPARGRAATLAFDGAEATVTVVVAEPGDGQLLGATALESLGFAVDPIRRQLVPQALLAM